MLWIEGWDYSDHQSRDWCVLSMLFSKASSLGKSWCNMWVNHDKSMDSCLNLPRIFMENPVGRWHFFLHFPPWRLGARADIGSNGWWPVHTASSMGHLGAGDFGFCWTFQQRSSLAHFPTFAVGNTTWAHFMSGQQFGESEMVPCWEKPMILVRSGLDVSETTHLPEHEMSLPEHSGTLLTLLVHCNCSY